MKLIKTNIVLFILFITPSFTMATSVKGVKLNNQAVELLLATIKSMEKKKQDQVEPPSEASFFDKLLTKFFKKDSIDMGDLDEAKLAKLKDQLQNIDKSQASEKEVQLLENLIVQIESQKKGITAGNDSKDKDVSGSESLEKSEMSKGLSEEEKKNININQELAFKAYKKTLEATIENDDLPEVRLNLGLAFELSGDLEKSFKSYNMAEKFAVNNSKLLFLAKYNKARVLGMQKKVDEALSVYQEALAIVPSSKEVKVNIELLLKQQQGGGGGGGDKDDKKGESDKGEGDPPPDAPPKDNPKNNEYKPQNLSKDDVKKILEELKNQEQKIREKENKKGSKEKPKDKDW